MSNKFTNKYTANQDIRDYMSDHGVTQKMLAEELGVSVWTVNTKLKNEMCDKDKEVYLNIIDSLAESTPLEEVTEEPEEGDVSCSTKFQLGDRVKIPSKQDVIAVVDDIWCSMTKEKPIYEVTYESNGTKGMYSEDQLELAPIPTEYHWEAHIDGNAAVVTMVATQGDKSWVYARGHAHILHDGEVGMAQAISYAAKRMFESLDSKQVNKIYVRGEF